MSNPYQSPQFVGQPLAAAASPVDLEKMRRVAKFQQWVLYSLLVNIVFNVAVVVAGANINGIIVGVVALVIIGFTMFAVFNLANEVYGIAAGIVCAILMVVPCISLLTLLIVN